MFGYYQKCSLNINGQEKKNIHNSSMKQQRVTFQTHIWTEPPIHIAYVEVRLRCWTQLSIKDCLLLSRARSCPPVFMWLCLMENTTFISFHVLWFLTFLCTLDFQVFLKLALHLGVMEVPNRELHIVSFTTFTPRRPKWTRLCLQ